MTDAVSDACRNCGTPAHLNFCPMCGQETLLHPPTVCEFMHEYVGHYVAVDGPLLRTMKACCWRPVT